MFIINDLNIASKNIWQCFGGGKPLAPRAISPLS
jgi:hypothetical protein